MLEPVRFVQNAPGNPSGQTEAYVPDAEALVFQAVVMEVLCNENVDRSDEEFWGGGSVGFASLGGSPEIARFGDRATASKSVTVGGTELVSRPLNVASAYREAVTQGTVAPMGSDLSPSRQRFVEWMDRHALTRSVHKCARFVRQALEAAGVSTSDRPPSGSAGDYGPYLMRHGAKAVEVNESYRPEPGDTAVFEKTAEHPFGHMEVFDGERWVSDFRQRGFSPYRDSAATPGFQVYRLP